MRKACLNRLDRAFSRCGRDFKRVRKGASAGVERLLGRMDKGGGSRERNF